jgi:hypothetical protein
LSRWICHKGLLWLRPGTYVDERQYRREVLAEFIEPEEGMDTVINGNRLRALRATMLVKCEDCAWSLTCMAGRLFTQHEHNHLCVECGRLVLVINEKSYPVQHHRYGDGEHWKDHKVIAETEKFFCEKRAVDQLLWEEYSDVTRKKGSTLDVVDPTDHNHRMRIGQCLECTDAIAQRNRGYRLLKEQRRRR